MKKQFGGTNHIVMLVIAIIAIITGILLQSIVTNKGATVLPETPSITLLPKPKDLVETDFTDHQGNAFKTADFKGKWSLVFFGFTHCPDICPSTLQTLKQIKQTLQSNNKWNNLQVVFITVDPKRDTPDKLNAYVPFFDNEFIGLAANDPDTEAFTKQLGILYLSHKPDQQGNYDVDHSASIILINPQAKMAGVLSAPHDAEVISTDLAKLNGYFNDHLAEAEIVESDIVDDLELNDSWIRPAPPASASMAGYGLLTNNTDQDIEISSVDSPAFEMVMIHNTVIENGVAKMLHLDELVIPAKTVIKLEPQGLHMMLMQPNADLQIGDHLELNIHTESGETFSQQVEVKPQPK